jgi:hypothetical protein
MKNSMAHKEKAETPKMEAGYHSSNFLSKALAAKRGSKAKSMRKGK